MENEKNLIPETDPETAEAPIEQAVEEAAFEPDPIEETPATETEPIEDVEAADDANPSDNLSSLLSELSQEDDSYLEQETVAVKKPINKVVIGVIIAAIVVAIGVVAALWFMANPPRSGELGNTIGNTMNNGFVCVDDGWTYYTKLAVKEDQSTFVVEKTDGKTTASVLEGAIMLSVADDHLYFRDLSTGGLSRTKLDGSEKQMLTTDQTMYYVIKGKYIYYITVSADAIGMSGTYTAHEMRLDGSNVKALADDVQMSYILPLGDALYYCNADDGCFYKMPYDGGTATQVLKKPVSAVTIADDQIYYSEINSEMLESETTAEGPLTVVYKAGLNGENPQKLAEFDDGCVQINVTGNRIYCTTTDLMMSKYTIHTMDTDGNDAKVLFDHASNPNIGGDLLYYINEAESAVYRANLDGSDPRPIQ